MESSRLLQRLLPPREGRANPYSFGAGLAGGGLSDEALESVRMVFEPAYMGAAEYEFGRLPEALAGMWEDRGDLVATYIEVPVKGASERGPVWIVARQHDLEEVTTRVRAWARWGGRSKQYWTRDSVRLDAALREAAAGKLDEHSTVGWLELNNGFFFGIDEEMAEGFCQLVGMKGLEPEEVRL